MKRDVDKILVGFGIYSSRQNHIISFVLSGFFVNGASATPILQRKRDKDVTRHQYINKNEKMLEIEIEKAYITHN